MTTKIKYTKEFNIQYQQWQHTLMTYNTENGGQMVVHGLRESSDKNPSIVRDLFEDLTLTAMGVAELTMKDIVHDNE